MGWWRYSIFRAGVDEGAFTQIGAGLFHGFSSTLEYNLNHLLVHASPILALTYPVVLAFHGALGLVLLQSVLVAATIIPVFMLARTRMPGVAAFGVALACAFYPPLSGEAVGDFHELAFAPPLAAALTYAIDRQNWRWAIAFAIILSLVKEDVLVGLAFIGFLLALTSRGEPQRRRCGLVIAGVGVAAAVAYFFVLRPGINPHLAYWSFHYYQWWTFPPTPNGFVTLDSPVRLVYLIDALAPLVFVPLLSRYALFALPGLLEVMASHEGITFHIGSHYSAAWSGYMLCAFADGIGVLRTHSKLTSNFAVIGAFIVALRYNQYDSPIEPGYFLYRSPNTADVALDRQLAQIPQTASVFASDALFAHLGSNPNASINFACQQYVVVDPQTDEAWQSAEAPMIAKLLQNGSYRVVSRDGAYLLRRTGHC